MKRKNANKMLDTLIKALNENPDFNKIRLCPHCSSFHLISHENRDYCCDECKIQYNNDKKKVVSNVNETIVVTPPETVNIQIDLENLKKQIESMAADRVNLEAYYNDIITKLNLEIETLNSNNAQAKSAIIISFLKKGFATKAELLKHNAYINDWHATAQLHGYIFKKRLLGPDYVIVPGQYVN